MTYDLDILRDTVAPAAGREVTSSIPEEFTVEANQIWYDRLGEKDRGDVKDPQSQHLDRTLHFLNYY